MFIGDSMTSLLTSLDYVKDDVDAHDVHMRHQVELLVRCENLVDMDVFSKTDPMCVLFGRQFGQWKELGRTEAVDDSFNPRFTETFILDYDGDLNAALKFSVYDVDSKSSDLSRHDFVGAVETDLSSLVQPTMNITQTLYTLRAPGDPKSRGQIIITAELVRPARSRLLLHLGACKLDKMGFLNQCKRSTCLEICRSVSENYFHPIYRTEIIHKNQDPRWRPVELSVQKLCNGDPDRQLQIVCWHIKDNNDQHFTGATTLTLREITQKKTGSERQLIKYKKGDKKKTPQVKGHIRFLQARLDMAFTVRDYVRGGCSLRFMLAIDFTSSNGDPSTPTSLHHLGLQNNEYIEAIRTMGAMLSHYDLEQNFPAFGFGAKPGPNKKTKHRFTLSGLRNNPYCKGLAGVLENYKKAVGRLTLSGPSLLAPVLKEATRVASMKPLTQDNQEYWVLLIITDGVVNDLDDTIEALVRSCSTPLSIVIVGIGPADFSPMEEVFWSHPDHPLTCPRTGEAASRRNVHFTALRKDKYITGANTTVARETLASVSSHMVEYLSTKELTPNRPVMHRTDPTLGAWVDDVDGDMTSRTSATLTSSRVQPMGLSAGPRCPTCGSCVDGTAEGYHNTILNDPP